MCLLHIPSFPSCEQTAHHQERERGGFTIWGAANGAGRAPPLSGAHWHARRRSLPTAYFFLLPGLVARFLTCLGIFSLRFSAFALFTSFLCALRCARAGGKHKRRVRRGQG